MATLTVRKITFGTYTGGATPKYGGLSLVALDTPAVGGDQFLNDGRTFFVARNTGGSINTVTIAAQKASDEGITTSCVVDIPATTGHLCFGPFDANKFNDVNGYCLVTYSGVTGLTVAAISLSEKARG